MAETNSPNIVDYGSDSKPLDHTDTLETLPGKNVDDMHDLDNAILSAQGHVAELERSFSWLGAVGLAFR